MLIKNKIITAFFLTIGIAAFGQINMADSSVQVITYWSKGEKQNYTITENKIKIDGNDTVSQEMTTYDVEITVLKETSNSYTVQWLYKNTKTNNPNPIMQKYMRGDKETKIIFKINELGKFMEVLNWKEMQKDIQKVIKKLRKEFASIPEMSKIITQIGEIFSTKEAIESTSIKEIQQFHSFHGAKYTLGEIIQSEIKVPNIYGTEPFDADVTISLDEINEEENNFILRVTQTVNQKQLINAVVDYLTNVTKLPFKREELNELKNEIQTASLIHGTGWVVYSIQTVTVNVDKTTNIEERIIDMK